MVSTDNAACCTSAPGRETGLPGKLACPPFPVLFLSRFAGVMGVTPSQMEAIALTSAEHQALTNAWHHAIPYGQGTASATREQVMNEAKRIYQDYPEILRALGL
jgi:hypothetical protein